MRNKLLLALLVGLWWAWAFRPSPSEVNQISVVSTQFHFSIDRNRLVEALRGDFSLMGQLITEWDIEAERLELQGVKGVQRLSGKKLYRSKTLSQILKKEPHPTKFLPQSYAAASILLALVHPDQIVALPKGLRKQEQLFPASLTNKIPEDLDRFHAEKLFLVKPDLAFVSTHYSHPAAIETLRQQGIELVPLQSLHDLGTITQTILDMGIHTGQVGEAMLLRFFMEASFMAIENQRLGIKLPRSLYVNAFTQLTTPPKQTFNHQLLCHLGLNQTLQPSTVLDQELLRRINPECVVVSSLHEIAIQGLEKARICLVDDEVQQSASQFAVLAYYDLVHAVLP